MNDLTKQVFKQREREWEKRVSWSQEKYSFSSEEQYENFSTVVQEAGGGGGKAKKRDPLFYQCNPPATSKPRGAKSGNALMNAAALVR